MILASFYIIIHETLEIVSVNLVTILQISELNYFNVK